ncbi:nucleoside/nucleotide kinase family protein [Salipiger marinus]|uniref:nucleoside/nucleotide kinase family protein n=1 Tax=Salipiger marinus TaxID=555512 RepID=UPI001E30B780|nr:nucleoside/nucleotide kinase family protein [Salipiger manganoxidans]MCD1618011.1 nucleoside/nucleotide kinase family protein [Salipiger manganoxidans]MEB3418692.1 nucleoside/nucleotide kinase family protein [Salipiger manganoxidans]
MARHVTMEGLLTEALTLLEQPGRRIMAIAGAPGSGKSTTAQALQTGLARAHPGLSAILPMDGFHYDDAVLHDMGRRPWKGAPDTFDVGGLASVLDRLRTGAETVAVPVFDRDLEISRGSARLITPGVRLILCEGNYLLLDSAPWDRLAACFDRTVMVDVPEPVLADRLRARWSHYDLTEDQIRQKLEGNDLPNGRTVRTRSRPADLVLTQ